MAGLSHDEPVELKPYTFAFKGDDMSIFDRPCTKCGRFTGSFCDGVVLYTYEFVFLFLTCCVEALVVLRKLQHG